MDTTKVGIVGVGYWGRKHVEEYSMLDGVEIAGICDASPKNLKDVGSLYNVENLYSDYRELFARDDITAISVCTDNSSHYEVAKAALEAGKHVLVEKPIAMESRLARDLVEAAKEKNRVLAVGHIYRFNNAVNKVRELVKQRHFGKIYYMKLQWTTTFPSPEGRDVLFDLAPHAFDIMNHILDRWPEKLYAMAKPYRREELEEAGFIMADFGGGIMGHIELSWLLPGKVRDVTVIGSERQAVVDCLAQKIRIFESGYDYQLDVERNNTIKDELVHFIACTKGEATATNSGEIGVRTVEMIEGAMESVKTGAPISWKKM